MTILVECIGTNITCKWIICAYSIILKKCVDTNITYKWIIFAYSNEHFSWMYVLVQISHVN